MSYEELSMRELQTECKARGLHTGRSKGELINRLNADDLEKTGAESASAPSYLEPRTPEPTVSDGTMQIVYEMYGQGPLTQAKHMELRVNTYLTAIERGYEVPAGVYGAWRVRSEGGNHTYAVTVRGRDTA